MGDPAPDTPGSRLRAARVRLGLTQAAAAAKLGVDQSTWCQYETGHRRATLAWLSRAAAAIGADPAELDGRLASTR